MKTIGLIGGMSWESSLHYYRLINEGVRARLGGLHSAELVLCSVDDFGVGFSNFDYLDSLPISKIKIDKAFVRKIGTTATRPALVVGIIALGHGLGLEVVAEGVETPEQLEFLREHGCDQIQGYVFSKPLAADQLASLLMLELVSPGPGRLGAAERPVRPRRTGTRTRRSARSA